MFEGYMFVGRKPDIEHWIFFGKAQASHQHGLCLNQHERHALFQCNNHGQSKQRVNIGNDRKGVNIGNIERNVYGYTHITIL